jgi:hypothetical protein
MPSMDRSRTGNLAKVRVDVTLVDGTATTLAVVAPDPKPWTAVDARRFVWDVWRRLLAPAAESLQLRELTPYGTWRLEFFADTGTAVTGPLRLSDAALEWFQSAVFDLSATGAVH